MCEIFPHATNDERRDACSKAIDLLRAYVQADEAEERLTEPVHEPEVAEAIRRRKRAAPEQLRMPFPR